MNNRKDYLVHYASPYYDPVKAHEYYMKNRELKGRASTKGMTESQRQQAQYVKKAINEERDKVLENRKNDYKSDRTTEAEKRDSEIKKYTGQMNFKIQELNKKLENMSPMYKKHNAERIKNEINSLREENASKKESLVEEYKSSVEKMQETYANDRTGIKSEYLEKYITELNRIKGSGSGGSSSGAGRDDSKVKAMIEEMRKQVKAAKKK